MPVARSEAARQYPEFADQALTLVAQPLFRGVAWQVAWKDAVPTGQEAWEFQNAAIRAYKRLAKIAE